MVLIVTKLCRLIKAGCDFNAVIENIEQYTQHTHVVFALSSFNNLIKNGRIGKITGFLAGKLGFWGIGIDSAQGTILLKEKVRGRKQALNFILNDIKKRATDIEAVVISHCQNAEFAESLKNAIQNILELLRIHLVKHLMFALLNTVLKVGALAIGRRQLSCLLPIHIFLFYP